MTTTLEPIADPASRYDRRWGRIIDTVALKQPDRMPVVLFAHFWIARYGGISNYDFMHDYAANRRASEKAVLEFEPDAVSNFVSAMALGKSMEALGLKTYRWPGHGVSEDQPYQYIDKEYMPAADYDEFLFDPTGYALRKFLPQVADAYAGLAHLPPFPALTGLRSVGGVRAFAKPEVQASLRHLMAAAEEVERLAQHGVEFENILRQQGYPLMSIALAGNPYDALADFWRGAINIMKDLHRHKDKILAFLDKIQVYMTNLAIAAGQASGHPVVMISTHWAADSFMSPKQFETFWWPSFRTQLLNLIDAGLIPMVLWQHDCNARLETIADVPAGKCIYWFERSANVARAFEVMGDRVALRGGLEASTMTTGRPEDVDAAVRGIVEKVWAKGGNIILDCGVGIPDETPVENVQAMFAAARKYAG